MIRKVWADPVWSKVIASGIIILISYVAISIEASADFIFGVIQDSFEFLIEETTVQNFWLVLLAAFALCGVFLICILLYVRLFEKAPSKPPWFEYMQDMFHGLLWRWEYNESGDIKNLHTLCPKCHLQILPILKDNWPKGTQLVYKCESCNFQAPPVEGDYEIVLNRVTRFIQQRIRTGKWGGQHI